MFTPTGILDLPVELLLQIFRYLDVESFLHFTSTCKTLHDPELVNEWSYWSRLVHSTFRVPNQPVVEKDGARWQKLFKRMRTQTRIYTWGSNKKACLGHSYQPFTRSPRSSRRQEVSWPETMVRVDDLGVISDLQCGGWSTTLLTAKGALYTVGVIDGIPRVRRDSVLHQKMMVEPVPLQYPIGFPHPYDRYDSSTAIKQFSSGRGHILALSDSGRIWSWQNIEHAALHVKFLSHDTIENGTSITGRGVVKKVVAGWNKSAALIDGSGIVVWDVLNRNEDSTAIEDTALVLHCSTVPKTSATVDRKRAHGEIWAASSDGVEGIGEVLNFIVLENLLLFSTHLGKVFVSQILGDDHEQSVTEPVELTLPISENSGDVPLFATDVQGSYRSFAIFTSCGAVLTSNQDRVMELLQNQLNVSQPLFTRIPALQHKDVIQLAFGDYHFHALHAQGFITSYGNEPQSCGALGLGAHGRGEGRLRGIRYASAGGDGRLVPHAYAEGRRVWFEREKRAWLRFITSGGADPAEAMERMRMAIGSPGIHCQGEVSEWIEQESRDWESKFGVWRDEDEGVAAYFVMSVTAAGWHSGALVLENEELATRLRRACEVPDPISASPRDGDLNDEATQIMDNNQDPPGLTSWLFNSAMTVGTDYTRWFLGMPPYDAMTMAQHQMQMTGEGSTRHMDEFKRGMHPMNYGASPRVGFRYQWTNDHFPRLVLRDGTQMPGLVPFDEWRYPRPEWDLDFQM